MAQVIIFTDRAPRTWNFDKFNWHASFFNYPAGAYKLASVLRAKGMKVIVVSNCLQLSFQGLKKIIKNNCKDLLWVGLSTTLFTMKGANLAPYRQAWSDTDSDTISIEILFKTEHDLVSPTEMVWGSDEIRQISQWLKDWYDVPMLVGGAWITNTRNGNLTIPDNCFLVTGNAEKYIEDFTLARSKNSKAEPSFICNNGDYDDVAFKNSSILWQPEDFVTAQSVLPLEIARGCAFNCSYCVYDRKSTFDSYKHPETLRTELIRNYELYGVTQYMLVDDLYNDSKEKVRRLYDEVWSRLPFAPEWTSYMRLDMIYADHESAAWLQASGAKMGSFGIETLDNRAGRKVGKGLGKKRILETLQYLKEVWKDDVLVHAYFLAGLPYESKDSIQETMDWSITTNLLHNVVWTPLWLTPPTHREIVPDHAINTIAKNTDQWNIKWSDQGYWINSEGVTYQQVNQMCVDTMAKCPMGMRISFSDYGDFRTAGLTHDQIAHFRTNPHTQQLVINGMHKVNNLIEQRLNKVLNLSD